ncbi:transcriptional regulator [bacterium]|nr:transcriptional regulator [bacterium]
MTTRLNTRSERLEAIERLLLENQRGLRAVEIADACRVDRRTVYRDLDAMVELGLPVYHKNGRFYINREYYLATVRLSANEAVSLLMAVRAFSHHASQQNPHTISALNKLGAALPPLPAAHVKYLTGVMRKHPVDRGFITVLETITRGWCEHRIVELWYGTVSRQGLAARSFATYFVEMTPTGAVRAVGLDVKSEQVRSIDLRRVMRARLQRETYRLPTNYNPAEYAGSAWSPADMPTHSGAETVEVVLVFDADVAPVIQEHQWNPWHPSQHMDLLEDGRCRLTFHVAGWDAMLPWIRGWGPRLEVIAPVALRQHLADEAREALARHHREANC